MKGNVTRLLSVLGAVIVIQSILWEYARMKPEYQFIVEPWSKRGYEIVHGSVAFTLGVLLLAFTLLLFWSGSMRPAVSAALTGLMWLAGVGTALIYADKSIELNPSLFLNLLLGGFIAIVLLRLFMGVELPAVPAWFRSGSGNLALWLAATIALGFGLQAVIGGNTYSVPAWVAVAIILGFFAVLAMASAPRELSANRMLITATIGSWIAVAMSAGAIRATLLRLQRETMEGGLSAAYKDAQVTSGWFLAQLGFLLAFVGAVAMWAKRRDIIINRHRAARQRDAAEKSAAEIQAALAASIGGEPPRA